MSNIDKWNIIVNQYNKNLNLEEKIIQSNWELLFSSIFNYTDSDIIPQVPVKMGVATKYADILIRQGREDLFVVELKKHVLSQQAGQAQLFSYLKQLNNDIGILVCDKLYIYDFDYTKRDENYSFVEINFIKDNPDGEKFVELFMNDGFDKQKIKDFIRNKNQSKNNVNLISKELNTESVLQILKTYFSQRYPIEDVEKAMNDICISVSSPKKAEHLSEDNQKFDNDSTKLSKQDIYYICKKNDIIIDISNLTLAGRSGNYYPANDNFKYLDKDWWIALDDREQKNLHIFHVPASSISRNKMITRSDKPNCFLLYIYWNNPYFADCKSRIEFKQWHVKTISY